MQEVQSLSGSTRLRMLMTSPSLVTERILASFFCDWKIISCVDDVRSSRMNAFYIFRCFQFHSCWHCSWSCISRISRWLPSMCLSFLLGRSRYYAMAPVDVILGDGNIQIQLRVDEVNDGGFCVSPVCSGLPWTLKQVVLEYCSCYSWALAETASSFSIRLTFSWSYGTPLFFRSR